MIMGRYRRSLNVVHRIKHITDTNATVSAATTLPTVLILGRDAPVLAATREVESGAKVHGIFLNVQIQGNQITSGAIPNIYMAVYKSKGGNIPDINPASTGANADKSNIIHQEMGMFQSDSVDGNPKTLFKGVIVIPKGLQRFGIDDELVITVRSTAVNFKVCIQCIYKEFR